MIRIPRPLTLTLAASLALSLACSFSAEPLPAITPPPTVPPTQAPADTAAAAATVVPTAAPQTPAPGDYRPLARADCQSLRNLLDAALGADFSVSEGPVSAPGAQGLACILTATGNGTQFDIDATFKSLEKALVGWKLDDKYAAGGPTGEGRGYVKGTALLLATVDWKPAPDANCPSDQPISACTLTPEQKLYTVTLQAAQK